MEKTRAAASSSTDSIRDDATSIARTTLSRRDFGAMLLGLGAAQLGLLPSAAQSGPLVFAIIGDYGWEGPAERDVAALVKSWNPEFIVTNGDNNYGDRADPDATQGSSATIDKNIGQYYHDFIYPYEGAYGPAADRNRFFPILADKDWNPTEGYAPYLEFFNLPGNERYYEFVWGPVHFFMMNGDLEEPDGVRHPSVQSLWLRDRLAASTAPWKLVHIHHPPNSTNGTFTRTQWPYAEWGADVVSSGQAHVYERLHRDGIVYFVNGLGGRSRGSFGTPIEGSMVRFGTDYGAQRVTATADRITFEFFTREHVLVDSITLTKPAPGAPTELTAAAVSPTRVDLAWKDNANDEGGFKVERSTNGIDFTEIASVAANTTTHSDTTAAPDTHYDYRVRSVRGTLFSDYSNVAGATTPKLAPGAPTQLTATAVAATRIDLAWRDNASDEGGFKVERSTDGTNFTEIASVAANTTTYSDTTAAADTHYDYRVRSVRGPLFSAYSNVAGATTPKPNRAPRANAGADLTLPATGLLTAVKLNGSGTDPDGNALTFEWKFEGQVIANSAQPTVLLPFGNHTLILTVRDPSGAAGVDTVQVRILLPANTRGAKITGDGTAPVPGGFGTFSLSAQLWGDWPRGGMSWSDRKRNVELRSLYIAGLIVKGTRGQVYGIALLKGGGIVRFLVEVDDLGEPGKSDRFVITLSNGYSAGGKLTSGNVKIHKMHDDDDDDDDDRGGRGGRDDDDDDDDDDD